MTIVTSIHRWQMCGNFIHGFTEMAMAILWNYAHFFWLARSACVCMRKGLGFAVSVLWKSAAKPQKFNKWWTRGPCSCQWIVGCALWQHRKHTNERKRADKFRFDNFFVCLLLRSSGVCSFNCCPIQIICFYRGICMSDCLYVAQNKLTHHSAAFCDDKLCH